MKTLYDFLFVDQEKMRSLYAQIYEGLLDVMTATDSSTMGKTLDGKVGGEPFAGLSRSIEESVTEAKQENMIPHDLVLRDVLAKLKKERFVVEDPLAAHIGNIVLLHGELAIMDPNLMLNMLKAIPKAAADFAPRKGKKRPQQDIPIDKKFKLLLSVMEVALDSFQPVVQFRVASDDVEAWGSIAQEHMRIPINSLLMQHGQILPGVWSMLGIVDNTSKNELATSPKRPLPSSRAGVEDALKGMREMFETPEDAICVTPLVIFRQLVAG